MSKPPPYSETELLLQLTKGNEQAFKQVFDTYMQPLCYFGQQIIHNKEEAEDIAIQLFEKFWQRPEGFTSMAMVKGFLYTSMRNSCLNYLKHQKVVEGAKDHLPDMQQENARADALMVKAEVVQKLYAEIEMLSPRMREILLLSIVHDLSTKEIAERLQLSESHVRADRSRAIVYLRKSLTKKGLLETAIVLLGLLKNP